MKLRKKFLSYILAGTCLCSPAKKEEVRSMEIVVGGCLVAIVLGVAGYCIYAAYQAEQARKAEINRRNTLLYFSNNSGKVTNVASQLIHKIPCSPIGNSMFDSLLSCKNDDNITTWSALVAANSNWDSSTLDSICNTLLAFRIECDVLQEKVKTKRQEEQEKAKLDLEKEKLLQKGLIESRKIYSKEKIAKQKIDSVAQENEKDRQHDTKKQIRQQIHEHSIQDKQHWHEHSMQGEQHWHENYMQDKQHWHEEDMNYPRKNYNYASKNYF